MIILLFCAGSLIFLLISGNKDIQKTEDLILQNNQTIITTEKNIRLLEAILADQRAYILTKDQKFVLEYRDKKNQFLKNLNILSRSKKYAQTINEIRILFDEFYNKLEYRAQESRRFNQTLFLSGVEDIHILKEEIIRKNQEILNNAYKSFNKRVILVENKKNQYFKLLFICIITGTVLILLFNAFLLNEQFKKNKVKDYLEDSEKRYKLILNSTRDGIFDWNMIDGSVFYSSQFFKMLGYDRKGLVGTTENFSKLLHPEDRKGVWDSVDQCIKDPNLDYNIKFRMKGKSGKWIWIRSRAKFFFNKKGEAIRVVGIHTNINDQVKTENKLLKQKQYAESASEAKGQFLAHMSHEIRTPLTAISGIAEILNKNTENFSPKHTKLIKTLLTSSNSLKDIITDVLDFSKIENNDLDLDLNIFKLSYLFEEIISMMSLRANEKNINFKFNYAQLKAIEIYGDKIRIRQILINLISNAIKFTDKGSVKVKAYIDTKEGSKDFIRIDVKDTGIGIAKKDFDNIFQRFKQADMSVSRKYGGTGLGLSISRSLAKLMGGDILFESKLHKGSIFSLIIPATIVENSNINYDYNHHDHSLNQEIINLSKDKKILLAEDYEPNIIFLSHFLDDLKLDYNIARTGAEAVKLWSKKDNNYDLILMDVQMPKMDGLTATSKIRALEKNKNKPKTPIIGMTAHALVEDRNKCIASGMDAYLSKPIIETDLKELIVSFWSNDRFIEKEKES